jgi:hypothetical protein
MIPSLPAPLFANSVLLSARFESFSIPLWSLKTESFNGIALTGKRRSLILVQRLPFVALGLVVGAKEFLFGTCA